MKNAMMACAAILVAVSVTACERPKSASEHNAVKDYVNVPKEKANDVKDKLEAAQDKESDEARKLLDADE